MSFSAIDHQFMAGALREARKGLWTTDPNPAVGCVIAQHDEQIGAGFTQAPGQPHAEIMALRAAGDRARGATVYTTLEPCSHFGRTPPCVDALIEAGVARVVSAMADPNPLVDGQGHDRLADAGIQVEQGLMEAQARALNPGFISRFERKRPWVRAKIAGSVDGRSSGPDGQSQWITSRAARQDGHRWRAQASAILTGIGTVMADNPALDVRLDEFSRRLPVVVVDSHARLPADRKILQGKDARVIQATTGTPADKHATDVLELSAGPDGRVPLADLMHRLLEFDINTLHVEAGPTLTGALLMDGLVDELIVYQAASLMGERGQALVCLPGMEKFSQRLHLEPLDQRRVGSDLRWIYRLKPTAA